MPGLSCCVQVIRLLESTTTDVQSPRSSEKACTTPAVIHNDHFALPEAKHGQPTALRDRFDWDHVTRVNCFVKQQVVLFLCHISTVSKGVWKPVPVLPLLQWTKHILSGQTAPPDPAHTPQPPTPHQASPYLAACPALPAARGRPESPADDGFEAFPQGYIAAARR